MGSFNAIRNPVIGDHGRRTVQLVGDFVLSQLSLHRQSAKASQPLFVGVQGPQGCGKSHLTALLPDYLAASPHHLRVASLSLDDLYSPHSTLSTLAAQHPQNKLVHGRGQPGTHDLDLGRACLRALSSGEREVKLPVYDKSRFEGQGDRSKEVVTVSGPVDVVIFEGWMAGFGPLSAHELSKRYEAALADPEAYAKRHLDYESPFFLAHSEEDLAFVNDELGKYEEALWCHLDCFVQLHPVKMSYIWQWRLQQEHAMKAKNGGQGMSDEEVKAFIARYMPGYELFMDQIQSESAKWRNHGLQLFVGEAREIVGTRTF